MLDVHELKRPNPFLDVSITDSDCDEANEMNMPLLDNNDVNNLVNF